jgi:hypothetical protein
MSQRKKFYEIKTIKMQDQISFIFLLQRPTIVMACIDSRPRRVSVTQTEIAVNCLISLNAENTVLQMSQENKSKVSSMLS